LLVLALALALAGVGVGVRSLASFVVLASIVVSTTISPYEQWLVGGVVALCDVATAGRCCLEKGPCEQRLTAAAMDTERVWRCGWVGNVVSNK
jgi:hypothetical protein